MNRERVNRPSSLQNYSESRSIPRAGYMPRTLVGAGGVRLYDIPGVIYPDYMLTDKKKGTASKVLRGFLIAEETAQGG